jgi:hypothetical protein
MTSKAMDVAIIGAGPSGLFLYKKLIASPREQINITIFEKTAEAGKGMPYSMQGALPEHITNVSPNEIPDIKNSLNDWVKRSGERTLKKFNITAQNLNEYKVLPRLFFGEYLAGQFEELLLAAKQSGIKTTIHYNTAVKDAIDDPLTGKVIVETHNGIKTGFDKVFICTGHSWPKVQENKITGWFDSPYPPSKIALQVNHPVAIKGASLTAIDAVKTLAHRNGIFTEKEDGTLQYQVHKKSEGFNIILHSIDGLLPAIRFHLEDSHLSQGKPFTEEEIINIKKTNDGFIPLDLIYNRNFKEPLKNKHSSLYDKIQHMNMEEFVAYVMSTREKKDPFILFREEYVEAERSIKKQESVLWKEMLAVLSFEMNHPAKHLSAEDMMRLKKTLMPLIAIIIAFVPQSSCRQLLALHEAGVLSVQPVDKESKVEPLPGGGCTYFYKDESGEAIRKEYPLFIDAVGQLHFMIEDFIFPTLVKNGTVSEAQIKFRDSNIAEQEIEKGNKLVNKTTAHDYWLKLPGININDQFQVLDKYGVFNPRIYIMAVPYIGGLNPDYSGLDFCERASSQIVASLADNA